MDLVKSLTEDEKRFLRNTPQRDWPWTISWLLYKRKKTFLSLSEQEMAKKYFRDGFAKATAIFLQAGDPAPLAGTSAPDSGVLPGDDHAADVGGRADP